MVRPPGSLATSCTRYLTTPAAEPSKSVAAASSGPPSKASAKPNDCRFMSWRSGPRNVMATWSRPMGTTGTNSMRRWRIVLGPSRNSMPASEVGKLYNTVRPHQAPLFDARLFLGMNRLRDPASHMYLNQDSSLTNKEVRPSMTLRGSDLVVRALFLVRSMMLFSQG
jgi:hypothetical protein